MLVLVVIFLLQLSGAYIRERNKIEILRSSVNWNFLFMVKMIRLSDVADWFNCRNQTAFTVLFLISMH